MTGQIETIRVPDFVVPLEELWTSPSPEALNSKWRISSSARIALASHNEAKISVVRYVLQQHGARLITTAAQKKKR